MPIYYGTADPETPPGGQPNAPYPNLLLAIGSSSPPALPNAASVDCDPTDVIDFLQLPVGTLVTTARGSATVTLDDNHLPVID